MKDFVGSVVTSNVDYFDVHTGDSCKVVGFLKAHKDSSKDGLTGDQKLDILKVVPEGSKKIHYLYSMEVLVDQLRGYPMYKFIIYSRKSRDAQDGHVQHTHQTNEWHVRNYLKQLDAQDIAYEIVGSYQENVSGGGYYTKRPVFRSIVERCKADRSLTLLVAKADRLARNVRTGAELMETINFVLANAPDADDMQKQLEFMIAEREYKNTSDRFKDMHRAKVEKCKREGVKCVWGGNSEKWRETFYTNKEAGKHNESSKFITAPNTRGLIKQMQLVANTQSGDITSTEFADKLNTLGVTTTTGKQWTPASVRSFARRNAIVYNKSKQKL